MSRDSRPVFISFATPNRDTAWKICQELEDRGHRCWISLRDLETGSRYGDEIVRQIRDADALVLVLSSAANESEFVHREVERAINYRTPVLPVRIEDVLPAPALELFVSANQWIDLLGEDFTRQMDRLSTDLRRRRRSSGTEDASGASDEDSERPGPPSSLVAGERRSPSLAWARKYGAFAAAALALAVFGVVNLSRGVISDSDTRPDVVEESPVLETGDATSSTAGVPGGETDATDLGGGAEEEVTGDGPVDAPATRAAAGPSVEPSTTSSTGASGSPVPDGPIDGVLLAVRGPPGAGAESVESILLSELSDRGLPTMDRLALDLNLAAPGPMDSERLGRLRVENRVALLVVGDLRVEAAPSVGGMYTGRATLSVRTYDTESRRLVGTETFEVGGGGRPGKIGASPMAASQEAVTQVAHQAAAGLARELRSRR